MHVFKVPNQIEQEYTSLRPLLPHPGIKINIGKQTRSRDLDSKPVVGSQRSKGHGQRSRLKRSRSHGQKYTKVKSSKVSVKSTKVRSQYTMVTCHKGQRSKGQGQSSTGQR